MSLFGDIISTDQVEDAVLAHVKNGLATYLDEVGQQRGRERGTYQMPRSYGAKSEEDYWPEDSLPCLLVVNAGTVEAPEKRRNGRYSMHLYIGVAIVVSARSEPSSRKLASIYIAAIRALILQRGDFDGRLFGRLSVRDWVGEDTQTEGLVAPEDTRSLAAGKLIFTVQVQDAVNAHAGPEGPLQPREDDGSPRGDSTPDYGDWPLAEHLTVSASSDTLDTTMTPDVTLEEDVT